MRPRLVVLADGSSIHTLKWLEGLSQTGEWDLYLISMNPAATRETIGQMPLVKGVHQIAPRTIAERGGNFRYLYNLPALHKCVRQIDPDAITSLYLTSYGVMGALLKGRAKLVHFVIGNDVMVFPDRGLLQRWLTQAALRRADFVISASQTMTTKLTQTLGYPATKILTQQYGVGDALLERPLTVKSHDFVSNRAWIDNSNIDYFLDILRLMKPQKVALIGRVIAGSELLGERILTAARTTACEIRQPLPYEENIAQVALARFLVSLTKSDGASLSVMEAMAVGTIPILSDIAPNREWVNHGENGFLIPPNNVAVACDIFKAALSLSLDQQKAMIVKNRSLISERGSLSRNMRRVSEQIKKLR